MIGAGAGLFLLVNGRIMGASGIIGGLVDGSGRETVSERVAFLGGLINYLLENDKIQHEYVRNYTDVSFVVREEFAFEDGMFSGYDAEKRRYDKASWGYEIGEDGYAVVDPTLSHPRCVFNLLKMHYSRYTQDLVSSICGTPKAQMLQVWETIAECSAPGKVMTIMYALGWTQHSVGSQMIRTGAMLQLLLGNIGMPGGGMNALRGHSNIQGLTDLGLLSNLLPGYLNLPGDAEQDYAAGDEVAILVNGLGGTPMEELYIFYRRLAQLFAEKQVSVAQVWVGEFATSMEMAGASISVLHLDDELKPLVARGANTPFFKHIAA